MKTDIPILKRLGPVPFWRGQVKCLDELARIYRKAMAAANEMRGGGARTGEGGKR